MFFDVKEVCLILLILFRQFEKIYVDLSTAPLTYISKKTGCQRPCSYKEYKFVNTNLKELTYADYPDDQLVLCLWAVSQYTQVFVFVLAMLQNCTFRLKRRSWSTLSSP